MADVNERIMKLLTMAAGSANIAEANIAAVKAAEMMRLHRIHPDDLVRTEYVFVHAEPASNHNTPTKRKESRWAIRLGRMIGFLMREALHLGRGLIFAMILRRM